MELSASQIALFTAILGVGATLLGVFISYCLASKLAKKKARGIAGAKLRAAFAPEIAQHKLIWGKERDGNEIVRLLKDALPRHAAAIEEYSWFVSPERQSAYKKVWEDYYRAPVPTIGESFVRYAVPPAGERDFKQAIKAILKFTEPN